MADLNPNNAPLTKHVRSALNLNPLPATGYVRLAQLIGDLNADPPIPPIIPVGKSSIWSWVKAGRFPAPVKIGPRVTAWDVRSVRRFLDDHSVARDGTAA